MATHRIGRQFIRTFAQLEDRTVPTVLLSGFVESSVTPATISQATAMQFAPDGKLYVLEQGGAIEVYQGSGSGLWTQVAPNSNFLSRASNGLNHITVNNTGERGLLGIAFHPEFATNRFVYIYYTVPGSPAFNRISRFTANAAGTQVVENSETILINLDPLTSATNHNGGAMHFGADGKLYVAVGDNATTANAQSIANRHGKILRYNPDGTIPTDNPTSIAGIAGTTTGANRAIWAAGLRNPYTFAFQPGTGRMHINDVGQNAWEEVNLGVAGANYGWSATEGNFNQSSFPNFTRPILWYRHSGTAANFPNQSYSGFAITGGAFYNPTAPVFPEAYFGDYFYADYVSSWIRAFDFNTNTTVELATQAGAPVDLKVGPDGRLFYLSRGDSRVYRIDFTGSALPYVVVPPSNRTVSVGQPVTFTVQAGGPGTLTYQWQRDGADIQGATQSSYTFTPTLADTGATFSVRVANATGSVTSSVATLTVNPNQPPVPTILAPLAGTTFSYGDTINYQGSATDLEDGPITSGSQFSWRVTYWTNVVERPFVPETSGSTSGSFTIPTISPYTLPDVFFRVYLTVTDSFGNQTTTFRDIQPNTAVVTLVSSPAGIPLLLDGMAQPVPHVFTGVTGQVRSIGAPASATVGGLAYGFTSWSDGGAAVHDISTPAANTTLTASYTLRPPRVAEFRVDDGSAQRSRVRSLSVAFDAIVSYLSIPSNAYTLTTPAGVSVGLVPGAIDNSTGRSVVTFSFTGGLDVDSLPNGDYSLRIAASELIDSAAQILDGNADGVAGGDFVANFHRLLGDGNGDRTVGVADFLALRSAFLGASATFDFDNNGVVNAADFLRFRLAFGTTL
jgi:glucose/arabinose dehydrogenase